MRKIIIFDLDDTLVSCKMKVPRQTYHMLNKFIKQDHILGIITYNYLADFIVGTTQLNKYFKLVIYGDMARDKLFGQMINLIKSKYNIDDISQYKIYYIDDRLDNIEVVKKSYDFVIDYHVEDIYQLYKFKYVL
jgi:hydroxymethylpyrimidine pyrophosphatase-like HAD family hydrolase